MWSFCVGFAQKTNNIIKQVITRSKNDMGDNGDATATSCGVPSAALALSDKSLSNVALVHSATQQRIALNASTTTTTTTPRRCLMVGRQKEADIRVQHGSISRQHAVFYYLKDSKDDLPNLLVMDLGGKHGTSVNGNIIPANQPVSLQQGDTIMFGKVRESLFLVEKPKDLSTTSSSATETLVEKSADMAAAAAAAASNGATTSVDHDHQAMQEAGKGLTGRAKRQAEIDAMMSSLDQDLTYTKPPEQPIEYDEGVDSDARPPHTTTTSATAPKVKVPKQHAHLPVTGSWDIPPDTSDGRLTCVAVDPPGSRFAVGRRDATLSLFDFGGMSDLRRQAFSTVHPQSDGLYPLQSLAYSPTGDKILVGSASVQPLVLDRDGQFLLQFARGDMYLTDPSKTIGHTAEVTAVAWHTLEKSLVFTASKDGSVRRWNVDKGKLQFEKLCCEKVWVVKSASKHKTSVTSLALHPSGRSFAVGALDGSLQIWSTSRTRPDKVVVAGKVPVTALCFSVDGKRLASRAADESVVNVWNATALRSSAKPLCTCLGVPTVHETAGVAFSPDGHYVVAGAVALMPARKGGKPSERGSLNFYYLQGIGDNQQLEPCVALETFKGAGPVTVHWQNRWNQVLVGCSDGTMRVHYDNKATDRIGGVWTSLRQSKTRKRGTDDDLQSLLNSRARHAGPVMMGEILTPLASQPKRRKRKDEDAAAEAMAKREPERPTSGKHKAGGAGSAVTTFAQFVADQSNAKDIAGKDPREALLKYKEGKSYLGKETKILDTKTMEEEEDKK